MKASLPPVTGVVIRDICTRDDQNERKLGIRDFVNWGKHGLTWWEMKMPPNHEKRGIVRLR
jgi:hypothetical protein